MQRYTKEETQGLTKGDARMSRAELLQKAASLRGGKDPLAALTKGKDPLLANGVLTKDVRGGGGGGAPTLGGGTAHTTHTTHRRDGAGRAERGGAASAGSLLVARAEVPRSAPRSEATKATAATTAPPSQRAMPRGQDRSGRGGDGQGKPTAQQGRAHGQEREGDNQRTGRRYGEDRERRARADPAERPQLLEGDKQREVGGVW